MYAIRSYYGFDRSHLHQVLWNLVGNALRHSTRGEAAVRVQAIPVAGKGGDSYNFV